MRRLASIAGVSLFFLLVSAAFAADITGCWKAVLDGPLGKTQIRYTFTQDGAKLSGTMQTAENSPLQISGGAIAGDRLTFSVKIADGLSFDHEGTVAGDKIQLTLKPVGEFRGGSMVASRVKQ